MISRRRPASRGSVGLALLLALAGAATPSRAGQLPDPTPVYGIPAGPFYLLPFIGFGVSAETNPFYAPTPVPPPGGDYVTRANLSFGVILPFSHSYVRFAYDGIFRRFAQTTVTNPDSRDLVAELSLLFGSYDRLVLLATETSGASEALRFDGGETTYNGTPFRYDVYTAGVQRKVPGRLGYEVAAIWSSLTFDQSDVNFFDFHGYDVTADANVPLASNLWLVAGAAVRRYDHIRTDDPTRSVFRQEHSNLLRAGVEGMLPGGGSYRAVLAYDQSLYPGGGGSDFKGFVLDAAMNWTVAPSTHLTLTAGRRPWSSFYGDNNYYLANVIGAAVTHTWGEGSEVGARLDLGRSGYADPVAPSDTPRRDRTLNGEVYALFAFPHRCGVRLAYEGQARSSNVDGVGYTARSLGVQFVAGWR